MCKIYFLRKFVLKQKRYNMTTVILDTRYSEAKKLLERLKGQQYAKIIEPNTPNAETIKAINEVEKGKGQRHKSVNSLMDDLMKG